MPCYQVVYASVEFKAKHKDLLLKAIERLQWYYREAGKDKQVIYTNALRIDLEREQVEFPKDYSREVDKLKRAYSEVVLEEAARRKKWLLKRTAQQKFDLKRV